MVPDKERQHKSVHLQHDTGHCYLVIAVFSTIVSRFLLQQKRVQRRRKPGEADMSRLRTRQTGICSLFCGHSLVYKSGHLVL